MSPCKWKAQQVNTQDYSECDEVSREVLYLLNEISHLRRALDETREREEGEDVQRRHPEGKEVEVRMKGPPRLLFDDALVVEAYTFAGEVRIGC